MENQEKIKNHFTLQWHLTTECDQYCKHCYLHDTTNYKIESDNSLEYNKCIKIIDDFAEMTNRWRILGRINFSGGDPLLRSDFFKILKYARKRNLIVGILGNSNHLDYETAIKLKKLGLYNYQMSIDGLAKTHDEFRGKIGLFNDTFRAIRILREVGIPSVLMFTLYKQNSDELINIIDIVSKEKVSYFDFSRLVPIGTAKSMKDKLLEPLEYRSLLLRALEEYKRLKNGGCNTYFGKKDPLWVLLYHELGILKQIPKDGLLYGGCSIGMNSVSLTSDGRVYMCRRLPIEIGKVPEENIRDIFIGSEKLNEIRDFRNLKDCSKCELVSLCRGCLAISYAVYGDYLKKDPQCWRC